MSKLKLVGLTTERNLILNALAKTSCAEIKECPPIENTHYKSEGEALSSFEEKAERVDGVIHSLTARLEAYARDTGKRCEALKENLEVPYGEFSSVWEREEELFEVCNEVEGILSKLSEKFAEGVQLKSRAKALRPYLNVAEDFSQFKDTRLTVVYFGTIPNDKLELFKGYANVEENVAYQIWEGDEDSAVVLLVVHRHAEGEHATVMSTLGLQRCPFKEGKAEKLYNACIEECKGTEKAIEQLEGELFAKGEGLRGLKVLSDFYAFEMEKLTLAEKFPGTSATFVMEAYVPKDAQEKVSFALNGVSENLYFEYSPVEEGEMPPTLMKNNKVVRNFEFVTNMYTPPNYHEFDPNPVMSIFFAVFLGFIMADIGYGLLMLAIGFGMASRQKKDTGMKRLMLVIGYSGIFTVIFGLIFSSFFGFSSVATDMNEYTIPFLPKPLFDTNLNWRLVGISIPSVLIISLIMGVVQLMASNMCKAYQEIRYGRVADGIFFGLIWVVFLAGLLMVVVGLIEDFGLSQLIMPGAITAVASLLIAMCTAGIRVSGFGKVTKGFGALYGIINYLSDILSYARLYGLMLSGAIIAQIVSGQGFALILSGNVAFIIIGVVVMLVGHAFNLAMGLLGGYIHDARLQYIEFFSRFYTGEGELFAPLGSKHRYISLGN